MTPVILDGKFLAQQIEAELVDRVQQIKERKGGKAPILATILVGDDPASATYVRMKGNACRRVGMESLKILLSVEPSGWEIQTWLTAIRGRAAANGASMPILWMGA